MKSDRFAYHLSRFLPLVGLVSAILVFFHKMAFTNLILARGDTFLYFYPYWQAAAEALQHGRVPLWNPQLFMGAPFIANSQVGFFYPFNWIVWLLLPTPYAVSASILLHLSIAAIGTYLASRRALRLSRGGAGLAGLLFALGGYLTAQVEHVNQLQGMAWLPWFLLVLGAVEPKAGKGMRSLGVGVLFALQLLSGHTQTAFISGIGLGVFLVVNGERSTGNGQFWRRILPLFAGGMVALGLAAIQLLPTLELTQFSSRRGGLPVNEAVSFSLHPLLIGQAILPGYGETLFSEYVAYFPLTAILLAFIGAWGWRRNRKIQSLLALLGLGLLFAIGRFNPLYWGLAHLPGFNLFRVPARWLVWAVLSGALLAGAGFDIVRQQGGRPRGNWNSGGKVVWWGTAVLLGLIGWRLLSVPLAEMVPLAAETPAAAPSGIALLGWLVELVLALAGLAGKLGQGRRRAVLLFGLAAGSLFWASRTLPYNQLTTPEAYFDVRPSIARLQAQPHLPPDRFLSLSDIYFDPGDQGEIDSIYAGILEEPALYDYTIAIKQKEIIAPNLPMSFGLAAVDGFDGGILPLKAYSLLTSLMLPEGVRTTDGRLRELLDAVPQARWLDLMNVRYLITDKVGDVWHDGVFFDLQHLKKLNAPLSVGFLPEFEATELRLVASDLPGQVHIETTVGETWDLAPVVLTDDLYVIPFPRPASLSKVTIFPRIPASASPPDVKGLTLVDSRDGAFFSLVLGPYRLIHSGDVKIYENLGVLPRAFLVNDWRWQPDSEAAVSSMSVKSFDPRQTAVLNGEGPHPSAELSTGFVRILEYSPEEISLEANISGKMLLVLTDAFYPGWQAKIDGTLASLYEADGMFRGLILPPGSHRIVLAYQSFPYKLGSVITLVFLVIFASTIIVIFRTYLVNRANRKLKER